MLIGVMSDTHDRLPMINAALGVFAQRRIEALIHSGDFVAPFAVHRLLVYSGTLYAIYGNNDGERAGLKKLLPEIKDAPLFLELGGRRILIHHFIDWCDPADVDRADIVITGHTHEVVNKLERGKLFLNPGECCGWVTGQSTVAVLDTDGPSADIIRLKKQYPESD